jgi:hypothetical protein
MEKAALGYQFVIFTWLEIRFDLSDENSRSSAFCIYRRGKKGPVIYIGENSQ